MHSWRVSIAGLMLVVIAFAAGLALMLRPSEMTTGLTMSAALFALGAALVGAMHARGIRRAGWRGFLVFAGGYLLLVRGPWFRDYIGPQLATSTLIEAVYERLSYRPAEVGETVWVQRGRRFYTRAVYRGGPVGDPPRYQVEEDGQSASVPRSPEQLRAASLEDAWGTGHPVFALMLGLIGAMLARAIFARENATGPPSAIGVDPPIRAGL